VKLCGKEYNFATARKGETERRREREKERRRKGKMGKISL
jgi:hypothetical protein